MRDNKGWDFLTAFEDIDEKYIYQAATYGLQQPVSY